MNPDAYQMALIRERDERVRAARNAHRAQLHAAAVARRRKAKRGGKR